MSLNTYLTFGSNCREVFEFYRSVFGGEFATVSTFREGPPDMGIPEEELDRIMHVTLPIGSSALMGSDSSSAFGPPPVAGNNFYIPASKPVSAAQAWTPRRNASAPMGIITACRASRISCGVAPSCRATRI